MCSADDLNRIGYRTHKGVLDHGDGPGQRHTVRHGGCHSCPIRCHVYTDVPALETKYGVSRYNANTCIGNSFGRSFFDNITSGTETAIEASQLGCALADDYGLWSDYGQFPRDLLYAYRKGIAKAKLDPKEYDNIPWKLLDAGDPAFLLDIMKRITYKQGELGKLFADGPTFLEKKWPEIAQFHQTYESSCWKDAHAKHHSNENGGQVGSLINMMYNRDAQCHTHSNYLASGLPLSVQNEIGAELFGTPDAIDANSNYTKMNKGKAVFARLSLVYLELHNSLTACNWTLPVWVSSRKDRKYRGDIAMESKALSMVTGEKISREEIEATGMRILHLFRALTARFMNEKDIRKNHDKANDWVFDYPADKAAFTAGVSRMDRADMELAKDLFYEEIGWDKATGLPTKVTLEKAGLKFAADELIKQRLIA